MCSNIEFSFAFIVQKVSEKLLYAVFSVVAEFFKIFRLLWPEGSEKSGNSVFNDSHGQLSTRVASLEGFPLKHRTWTAITNTVWYVSRCICIAF
jgi:hypothetical protein